MVPALASLTEPAFLPTSVREVHTLFRDDAPAPQGKHGISRGTFFVWKSKYGGATVAELKRLRELEAENAKLKRMYAELALENTAIKDVLSRKL